MLIALETGSITDIVSSSIPNGRITSRDIEPTNMAYTWNNDIRRANNEISSFLVKTLKNLENLQHLSWVSTRQGGFKRTDKSYLQNY